MEIISVRISRVAKLLAGLGPDELTEVSELLEEWRDTLSDVKDIARSCDCEPTVARALKRHVEASCKLVEYGLLPTCAELRAARDEI
jgi:hypothetical protein